MSAVFTGATRAYHAFQDVPTPFTFALWFRVVSLQTSTPFTLNNSGDFGGALGYSSIYLIDDGSIRLQTGQDSDGATQGRVCTAAGSYSVGKWHHFVAVERGSSRTVWLDGAAQGDNSNSGGEPTINQLSYGALFRELETGFFDGLAAEFAVWTYDIGINSASMLANGISPLYAADRTKLIEYRPYVANSSGLITGVPMAVSADGFGDHPPIIHSPALVF